MGPKRSPTIRDVARITGVSRSTVSLVINDSRRISAPTAGKVLAAIRELGYEPNVMARGLARRRAKMIAILVPQISSHVFSDFYFSEAISGISDALSRRGYRMLIEIATEDFLKEGEHLKLFRERQIDGMLLLGTLDTDRYIVELSEKGHPLVLVNSSLDGIPCVLADNLSGSRVMVNYLASLGHRRIAFIGGLESTTVGMDRTLGYKAGLKESGIRIDSRLITYGNYSEESGYDCMRKLWSAGSKPTAVFAANDMMAIGALKFLRERGIKVPHEMTVVGADDIKLASYVEPPLTTIRQPMYEIGRLATGMLLEGLSGKRGRNRETVRTELVVRLSSAPPSSDGGA
ncbi:MAG: LacI family DNA-binding transcriptional regulator [Candidatus Eisenbacteria bacterium]|nr:LacI family DNA-binding transcriptional regulator [Candidatus Eisenbacteria bacterium]